MKILLFSDSLGAGGAQRQLVGLACMLKDKGYDVKVGTYYDIDFYKHQLDEAGVPNELIPEAGNTKKRILTVRSYFKKESPDWVIAYQETPSLVACMCKCLGCDYKLIVSERNTTQKVGLNERVRFLLYRFAEYIVPNSYSQERWLVDHHSWMLLKIHTITNFVDLNKFAFCEHCRRKIPEIMVAASAMESKNVFGYINACKELKDEGVKFHTTWYGLVGDLSNYQKEAFRMIRDLGIEDVFSLVSKVDDIQTKYQESDYFCLPSFFEGVPNVICEAMSVGLPILCSRICDNPKYVHEGVNGFLFDPNDALNVATQIKRAILIPDNEYDNMCHLSRKIAEEMCGEATFVSKYLDLFKDCKK